MFKNKTHAKVKQRSSSRWSLQIQPCQLTPIITRFKLQQNNKSSLSLITLITCTIQLIFSVGSINKLALETRKRLKKLTLSNNLKTSTLDLAIKEARECNPRWMMKTMMKIVDSQPNSRIERESNNNKLNSKTKINQSTK